MKKIFLTPIVAVATTAAIAAPITLTSCNKKTPFDMQYDDGTFESGMYNVTKDTKYTYNGIFVVKNGEKLPTGFLVLTINQEEQVPTLKLATLKIGDKTFSGIQDTETLSGGIYFTITGVEMQDKQSVSLEITYSTDATNVATGGSWTYVE